VLRNCGIGGGRLTGGRGRPTAKAVGYREGRAMDVAVYIVLWGSVFFSVCVEGVVVYGVGAWIICRGGVLVWGGGGGKEEGGARRAASTE